MIHLIKSNNLERLSVALAEKLADNVPENPLEPQSIIVPNLDTARWFKLFAAEKNGIAANLECILPAEWLWRQIRKIYPDLESVLPSDLQPMKWSLFQLLSDEKTREKFERLNQYLIRQPEERRHQATFQMAGQIASVFDEYLVYRPDMNLRWQEGKTAGGDESWQSELWRTLVNSWKGTGTTIKKNRAELFKKVFDAFSTQQLDTDDFLYLLNPGLMPMPIVKLLGKIGYQSELYIYQIELSKQQQSNHNELIQAFGRELKNTSDVLNTLDPRRTRILNSENSGQNTLHHIQNGILNGESVKNISDTNTTITGIEIRSCHTPLREIEVLHQFLLEQFENDSSLQPDDILVATPDLETYRPYIKAVFDQAENKLPKIPYHAGYSGRNTEFGLERTLLRLLSVIDSRFEFSSVMDLFMMSPIHESYGVSESDTHKLKRWIEENHVIWGVDADHRKEFNQPGEELQTWNIAMRRGWLGHLLGGKDGEVSSDLLLFQSIQSTQDQEIWAGFSSYLRHLDRMRKEILRKKNCMKWADWFLDQMDTLLDPSFLVSMEAQKLIGTITKIKEHADVGESEREIPYSLFKNELNSMLDSNKASGALFSKGVTFSSMVPVRSIPFKIIALIGLNGGSFPRKEVNPDYDLMAKDPKQGERNRKNEDRNLFLESIMAAGQIHYCSYIGQSSVDNEVIPASTIVNEWTDILSSASGIDSKDMVKKEALSGFSISNFESNKSYSDLYLQTAQTIQNDEDSSAGLKLPHPIPLDESEEPIQVDELTRFYSNPIQWFLRKRFEISLREPESDKNEFELDHLEKHILFQRVFGWVLDGMQDEKIFHYLMQSGVIPLGWAGEKKAVEIKKNVQTAISLLHDAGVHPKPDQFSVDLLVEETQLEGSLYSYSDHQFVDITPSGFSGRIAINSWINHLCACSGNLFRDKKSLLYCDLKKGNPVGKVFKPAPDAEEILKECIDFYTEGLCEPKTFFPQTLFAFEEREREGKADAYQKAANAFNTDDFSYGENNNLAIQALLGQGVEFQKHFITERYRKIMGRMIDHMEDA